MQQLRRTGTRSQHLEPQDYLTKVEEYAARLVAHCTGSGCLGGENPGMIIDVHEPEYSQRQLEKYEQQYGMPSSEFYERYRSGRLGLHLPPLVAGLWAFEYEINSRARELLNQRPEGGQAEGEYPLPLSLTF